MKKNILLPITLVAIILGVGLVAALWLKTQSSAQASSFDECVAAGNPIMESYPEQCRTADGRTFTRPITGQPVTVSGTLTCLPHKNAGEVITLECAYGVKDSKGEYYALNDPEMERLSSLNFNVPVTIGGTLDTSTAASSKYDIQGTITVTSATQP